MLEIAFVRIITRHSPEPPPNVPKAHVVNLDT
jgi:hypothetical protein